MEKKKGKVIMVIGLGEIGKPLFTLISRMDRSAIGVDLEPVMIESEVSLMHICYPYVNHNQFVETTVEYCKRYHPEVVIINSTVTPGTTRQIEQQTSASCIYSPIRGKHTKMESDLLHYTKFVAGTNTPAARKVERHFISLGMKTKIFSSPEAGELAKLLETTYFGLLIGWAQEMDRFSNRYDVDYFEMSQFFEEIAYLPGLVFQPGFIGGHCVMPNIGLLQTAFDSEFLNAIIHSNEKKGSELGANANVQRSRIQPIAPSELASKKPGM